MEYGYIADGNGIIIFFFIFLFYFSKCIAEPQPTSITFNELEFKNFFNIIYYCLMVRSQNKVIPGVYIMIINKFF